MVKIKQIKSDFIKDNINSHFSLNIFYNCSLSCLSTIISKKSIIKINKTKISFLIYGSCIIEDKTCFFKAHINFIFVDNSKNLFLSNVSINQVNITDDKYENLFDSSNDDFIENIIYDLIEQMFISSICSQNIENDKYIINFNVPIKNNINDKSLHIVNLSSLVKIGIFYNNL